MRRQIRSIFVLPITCTLLMSQMALPSRSSALGQEKTPVSQVRMLNDQLRNVKDASQVAAIVARIADLAAKGDPEANQILGDVYSRGGIVNIDIDGDKAIRHYRASSEAGNALGYLRLGELYGDGKIVKADADLAFRNFQKAADAGLALGQFRLGEAYIDGIGTKVDPEKGISLLIKAADAGEQWASYRLGDIYSKGGIANIEINGEKAVKYYKSSAEAGNAWGHFRLGELYGDGKIVKADTDLAFRNFQKAADAGLAPGQFHLGKAYIDGIGTKVDTAKGISLLTKAADAGDPWAKQMLGDLYSKGDAIAVDSQKAVEYYRASAEAGNAWAHVRLGELYRDGIIVKADAALAFESFQKAADAGLAMGKVRLGEAYLQGIGVAANGLKGIALVEEGVADQDKWSLPILGDYLSGGYYAKSDMKTAIKIYEKAGKAGNGWAYLRLGRIYSDKRSSSYDPAKALGYLKLATDMGVDEAKMLIAVGHIHQTFGKLSKRAEGVKLLEDLAEKQYPDAVVALATNKFWGIGVRRDPKGAMEMLEKASAAGNAAATRQLIKTYRDRSGGRVKQSIPKAEAILEKNRGQFSPSQYQREELLIAAAKAKSVERFSEISKRILEMPPATYLDTLVALKDVNSNAFIYFAQQQMQKRNLYNGPIDGMLTELTIEAIRKLCIRRGLSEKCRRGPLDNEAARAISVLIDPNRIAN